MRVPPVPAPEMNASRAGGGGLWEKEEEEGRGERVHWRRISGPVVVLWVRWLAGVSNWLAKREWGEGVLEGEGGGDRDEGEGEGEDEDERERVRARLT